MSNSEDSVFDPEPVPEKQAGQARLLAMLFYIALQRRMHQGEAGRPFDPSHHYGKLDMSGGWSQCSPEMRQWWIDAASEAIQKFTSGTL